ncbi:hypothetical protein ABZ281_44245, partial [Streptomyces sp. NPDC006265]|uniref:hypothetical protein n=1 Tax=Streptomyces sp. NPDC006265 TaxID=3156740 RepID=UPI0033AD677B
MPPAMREFSVVLQSHRLGGEVLPPMREASVDQRRPCGSPPPWHGGLPSNTSWHPPACGSPPVLLDKWDLLVKCRPPVQESSGVRRRAARG